jgi:hypothetical protein
LALICHKNSQLLAMSFWGTFGVGNVMFPAFLSGSRLPENSARWVAGQSNQQLAWAIIGTLIGLDARGMCSGG